MGTQANQSIEERLAKARAKADQIKEERPFAMFAFFREQPGSSGKIVIHFSNGTEFAFPPEIAQGLTGASVEDLSDIKITPSGLGLHWEKLDADLSIPEMLGGILGTQKWMAELGRKGGQSTSEAKVNAARINGKKGGRPKN